MVSKFEMFLRRFKWYRKDQGGSWRKISRGWVPTSEAEHGEIRFAKEKYPEKTKALTGGLEVSKE